MAVRENYVIVSGMARTELATSVPGPVRDHGFHRLRVGRVVRETADTSSFVLEVPEDLCRSFTYQAGQFCNLRVEIDGRSHVRCYSMSSSPALGEPLQVTVKRVPDGLVSNWLLDHVDAGDEIRREPVGLDLAAIGLRRPGRAWAGGCP